jgi:hypothetical protein
MKWVALGTIIGPDSNYEAGGVYDHKPRHWRFMIDSRPLGPDEREAPCPRCGQKFVAIEQDGWTAEQARDHHLLGDENTPPACLKFGIGEAH